MKKKELVAVRSKNNLELKIQVSKRKIELVGLYAKMKAGQEKNLKKVKNLKRDLAQLLTVIREKELLEESLDKQQSNKKKEES